MSKYVERFLLTKTKKYYINMTNNFEIYHIYFFIQKFLGVHLIKPQGRKMKKIIGKINWRVIKLLNLDYKEEIPIVLGDSNIIHMKNKHYDDYKKYGADMEKIISNPTYVAKNPKQDSIEYIKEYKINNEFVLVAVRISNNGNMFARTLFIMSNRKKNMYLKKGYVKKYK